MLLLSCCRFIILAFRYDWAGILSIFACKFPHLPPVFIFVVFEVSVFVLTPLCIDVPDGYRMGENPRYGFGGKIVFSGTPISIISIALRFFGDAMFAIVSSVIFPTQFLYLCSIKM